MTFVADGILAMTDIDILAGERGTYDGALGARFRLKLRGCHDVAEWLAGAFETVAPAEARRGDVGIVAMPTDSGVEGMPAAVLFIDRGVIGRGQAGLIRLPTKTVISAFRIG